MKHETIIETAPTAQRIRDALRAAQEFRSMALIIGESGTGKTTGLKNYASSMPHTWMMTLTPVRGEQGPFMIELSVTMGDRSEYSYRRGRYTAAKRAMEQVEKCQLLAKEDGEGKCLLIVDEAHHLSADSLEELRGIHDRTGIAVALAGNRALKRRTVPFVQLESRIGIQIALPNADPGDVKALIEAHGISDQGIKRYLNFQANQPGALRNVASAIRIAREIAGEEEPSMEHFAMANCIKGAAA